MKSLSNLQALSFLQQFSRVAAFIAVGIGVAGVAGWVLDIPFLLSPLPNTSPIKFNTSICFFCAGISLWLSQDARNRSRELKSVGQLLAVVIIFIGSITLGEYLFHVEAGIDQLFVKDLDLPASPFPGRMSPVTAFCFILWGLALIRIGTKASQYFSLSVVSLSLIAVIGYIFDYQALYEIVGYGSIAFYTAITLLILSLGLLAARPEYGILRLITSNVTAGRTVRVLLPLTVLLIILLGWVVEIGERLGIITTGFESVVLVTLLILIYSPLIYFYANRMNQAEIDILRLSRLYATLSQVNQTVVRVKNREELYRSICNIAVQFGEFTLAWVGLLEEASGEIKPTVANGLDVNQWPFPNINIHHGDLQNGLIATAIRTSRVVTSEDIQADQRNVTLQRQIEDYGYHSSAAVPFRLRGKTIGAVGLVSKERDFFHAEAEAHLLEEMGRDISFALDAIEKEAERKHTEEALHESEERFSKAFYQSPIGIALVDLTDFTMRDVNDTLLELVSLTREQMIGQNVLLIDLQIEADVRAAIGRELQEHGMYSNQEVQLRLPSGERRYVLNSGARVTIGGKPHNLSLFQDITERKRAEEMLRESEQKFSILFEKSAFAISLSKLPDGVIVNVNEAFESAFGFTKHEAIGKTSLELGINPDAEGRARLLAEINEHGSVRNQELVLQTKRGESHIFSVNMDFVAIGAEKYILNTTADITERRRVEEQVRRQLKQLNALRSIDIAISSSFDLDVILEIVLQQVLSQLEVDASAIMLFNSQLQALEYVASRGFKSDALRHTRLKLGEGYASQAVLQRKTIHISALIEGGAKRTQALQIAHEEFVDYYGVPLIAKGEVKGVLEIYHRSHLKGDAEWLEFLEALAGQAAIAIDNAQLFENLQRSNLNLEVRVVERTAELQRTNAELEHANRIKDEFLANMSHELRTPLTSILGLSESLLEQRRSPLDEHQQKSLEVIESSGQHLLQLINDILDLSKIEAGRFDYYPQPVLVDDICRSSLSFIKAQAAKKSINVTYVQDLSTLKIFTDPRRLKQILVNLLNNAVKFTHEKGEVILQVTTDLEQDLIRFSVVDNGIGISQEDLQRLFQPFVQLDSGLNRQHEGTGLGLALVQKLTELQGGSIQVESAGVPGKGSRFTINLPCLQEEVAKLEKLAAKPTHPIAEPVKNIEVPAEAPNHLGVILVADDNMTSILTIGEYLESHGYEVIVAHDGSEALKKAEEVNPDLILMDIQMPVMNGVEAMGHLRAAPHFANTPIIALTALAMSGDRERAMLAGADEYMSKPVSLKALRQTIEALLLNRSNSRSEAPQ